MLQLTRLEAREILAHVDREALDADVLAKLCAVAASRTPTTTPPLVPAPAPTPINTAPGGPFPPGHQPYAWGVLTEKMIARGWTQADVDTVNEEHRAVGAMQARLRPGLVAHGDHVPDARLAAFAPPEMPVIPTMLVAVGAKNQWGDECVKYQGDLPVFRCKEDHGYTPSPTPGCPRCWAQGGDASESALARRANDPDAVSNEESNW